MDAATETDRHQPDREEQEPITQTKEEQEPNPPANEEQQAIEKQDEEKPAVTQMVSSSTETDEVEISVVKSTEPKSVQTPPSSLVDRGTGDFSVTKPMGILKKYPRIGASKSISFEGVEPESKPSRKPRRRKRDSDSLIQRARKKKVRLKPESFISYLTGSLPEEDPGAGQRRRTSSSTSEDESDEGFLGYLKGGQKERKGSARPLDTSVTGGKKAAQAMRKKSKAARRRRVDLANEELERGYVDERDPKDRAEGLGDLSMAESDDESESLEIVELKDENEAVQQPSDGQRRRSTTSDPPNLEGRRKSLQENDSTKEPKRTSDERRRSTSETFVEKRKSIDGEEWRRSSIVAQSLLGAPESTESLAGLTPDDAKPEVDVEKSKDEKPSKKSSKSKKKKRVKTEQRDSVGDTPISGEDNKQNTSENRHSHRTLDTENGAHRQKLVTMTSNPRRQGDRGEKMALIASKGSVRKGDAPKTKTIVSATQENIDKKLIKSSGSKSDGSFRQAVKLKLTKPKNSNKEIVQNETDTNNAKPRLLLEDAKREALHKKKHINREDAGDKSIKDGELADAKISKLGREHGKISTKKNSLAPLDVRDKMKQDSRLTTLKCKTASK